MPASYDWTGIRYEWRVPSAIGGPLALDVERLDTPRPENLVPPGWNTADFLAAWTRAEVLAKLLDTPVALWIKANPFRWAGSDRWFETVPTAVGPCRVFTGIDRPAAIVLSCGWRVGERTDLRKPASQTRAVVGAAGPELRGICRGGLPDDQS